MTKTKRNIRYIDLFCGVGGFRIAIEEAAKKHEIHPYCVFSSDIDTNCQKQYLENFEEKPKGDIKEVKSEDIPDHDILLAGFPCQPFSIIGNRKGFEDTRGTLFFDIARILESKKPTAFVLENVKLLARHNKGKTLKRILETLNQLGYKVDYRIFNAIDFGLPHKRERIFIAGFRIPCDFSWPTKKKEMTPLDNILEKNVPSRFFASERIRLNRLRYNKPTKFPTIWHENKAGNVSVHNFSCALRAGASYNYLLVNGERRLTPREMFRLQGFPESYKLSCTDYQLRKQAGNSLPVPVASAVISQLLKACFKKRKETKYSKVSEKKYFSIDNQYSLFEKRSSRYAKSKAKKCREVSPAIPS